MSCLHQKIPYIVTYTTLFRSTLSSNVENKKVGGVRSSTFFSSDGTEKASPSSFKIQGYPKINAFGRFSPIVPRADRKSTRLISCHLSISYAVFCLKNTHNINT